jgi:hypothetical protein
MPFPVQTRILCSLTLLFVFSAWAQDAASPAKTSDAKSAIPVEQPLPFSHKAHSKLGFKCQQCHTGTEDHMGLPVTDKCMACHSTYLKDNPNIKKLADFAEKKEPVPWKRVYRLPDYVWFSHATHLKAGAKCEDCHGAVADQVVLAKPAGRYMQGCMNCHGQHNASNDCQTCHEAAR